LANLCSSDINADEYESFKCLAVEERLSFVLLDAGF
jgi:hypothetical protein